VLAKLEAAGVEPSPEAHPETLLRRLSLDLIGLPPTVEEQSAPDDHIVDRLLASPHYGEKWGRHWLDQARYADSDGYRGDAFRPHAWRWRHWVIEALNRDMPFDQFTIEQIAGDLLPDAATGQWVATGFHRNTLTNREGGIDPEQFRVEAVMDRVNTIGTVWLGLTVGCAQCHDHKYDPISQRDYYRLFAFFNTAEEWYIDAPLPGESGPYLAARPAYDRKRESLLRDFGVPALQAEWEKRMIESADHPGKWLDWDHAFDDLRTSLEAGEKILRLAPEKRNRRQEKLLTDYFVSNYNRVVTKERSKELRFDELRKALAGLDRSLPALSQAAVIRQEPAPRATHLLQRGDYRSPGDPVTPGVPSVLHPLTVDSAPTRLDLARWLVSDENPLTARVIVNRIWQEYFGRGLVKTSENFGTQGEMPSHAELLDWLAAELIEHGWRLKHIHRLIVSSATYRQSSVFRPAVAEKDPENKLIARQARVRLPAELIRDSALRASGLLNPEIGGRSVRPPQPDGVSEWEPSKGVDRYRRGMYTQLYRNKPHPFLANFDAPNGYAPVCRRMVSNTPLQALNLLNDPVFVEAARVMGRRLASEQGDFAARLTLAFRLCLGRLPSPAEQEDLLSYFQQQKRLLAANRGAGEKIMPSALTGAADAAAWAGVASILMNADEFMTRE
jgi:hypothetical protein